MKVKDLLIVLAAIAKKPDVETFHEKQRKAVE